METMITTLDPGMKEVMSKCFISCSDTIDFIICPILSGSKGYNVFDMYVHPSQVLVT